jgi:adenine-specific DNA-methyltransferase
MTRDELSGSIDPDSARIFRHDNLASQGTTEDGATPVLLDDVEFRPPTGSHWKTSAEGMARLIHADRVAAPTSRSLAYVRFLDDFPISTYSNIWLDTQTGAFTDPKVYVVQTNTKIIERCMLMCTDPGDLVLDPTCGSARPRMSPSSGDVGGSPSTPPASRWPWPASG